MPDLTDLYEQAEQLKQEGKYDDSVAKLNEILEQDDSYVLAHMSLAVLLGNLGQHDKAVKHGERACELEPEDAFNYTAMSVTYQRAFAGTQNYDYIRLAEDAMAKSAALQQRA